MRLVVLGAPRPLHVNRWKDDLCEGAEALGWSVLHLDANGIPADAVVAACRGADWLIWAKTHLHNPTGDVAGMLRRIEDAGTVTVGLHLDLYWGIARREAGIGVDPWWSCQYMFTADGGPRPWGAWGVNHHWCPPPVGARWIGRGAPADHWRADAVFVGRWVPRIHGVHRRDLLRWAARRWGREFLHVDGRRWRAWGYDLSRVYVSARVAVGDSARADGYWSDRVPCTLARGGLLAHPEVPGMAGQGFSDDVMVTYPWGRFDLLGQRLDSLSDTDRARLTSNAMDLIRSRHTWAHRLAQISEVVFGAGHHRLRGPVPEVGRPAAAAAPGRC